MAAPLNTCNTIEQRGVVRFLWAKYMDAAKDIHKEMLPIWGLSVLWEILCLHIFAHKKRTTPRCSIVLHVFRGAAIL
jgi:hypothetical protein